jgi:hypothetical protein
VTNEQYLILGYAVAIGFLWGYAVLLWVESRKLRRRERSRIEADQEQP